MRRLVLLLVFLAPPAHADGCDDLWFTRNLIMDRAGYCFGSSLGRAVFDNGDCAGTDISLDPGSADLAEAVRAMEARHGCAVDTTRGGLDLDDAFVRRRLADLPIRDEFESACLGWRGPATPLRSGHDSGAAIIGQITPGDHVRFSHLPVGPWSYVTVTDGGWTVKGGGWLGIMPGEEACEAWAG